MVMKTGGEHLLWRKLLRDVRHNWKSFGAVFVICMLSTMLYCGIDGAWRGMEINLNAQFAKSGLSSVWVVGAASDRTARDIAALPSALDAQRRVHVQGEADLPGDPTMELYMSDGPDRVSAPLIFEGKDLAGAGRNVCVLDSQFAKAFGISVGDRLKVKVGSAALELLVGGIGYSPEYVAHSDGFDLSADPKDYGYAWVSSGTLGHLNYQETVVLLAPGADDDKVKRDIQTLLDDPTMKVLTRDDKVGVKMAVEEVDQVRALGQVFPAVFFLVAALITFSTMKRLVDNQRLQIGTLSSLGYGRWQLIRHYMSYGLLVGVLGALLGLVGARFILGEIVIWALKSIYTMPGVTVYLHPGIAAGVSAVTVLIAMGASFFSCSHLMGDAPAELLRPKPPAHGKRVFLERIPPLWKPLSFSAKLITRNMLRNGYRLLIGIIGVVGCSTLLLTGFGMRDSVMFVLENHYTKTMRYDVRVDLGANLPVDYPQAIKLRAGAQRMEAMMDGGCELLIGGSWQQKGLYVLEDRHEAVYFEKNGQRVYLPRDGVALTQRTAEETGLKIGDSVLLRAANGYEGTATVSDIVSIQLGQGVYVSKSAWRKLDIMPYMPTTLYLTGGSIDTEAIDDMDGVAKVRTIQQERTGSMAITSVLDVVVLVMVLFSGALLLVVLFTLGQLNFFERIRELATLMVLGFYPKETKHLILRENIILSILGLPLGLYMGPYLHRWVLAEGFPTMLEFIPYIALPSWIYTPLLTLAFAWIVNIIIGWRFKEVNMVEALKSVE